MRYFRGLPPVLKVIGILALLFALGGLLMFVIRTWMLPSRAEGTADRILFMPFLLTGMGLILAGLFLGLAPRFQRGGNGVRSRAAENVGLLVPSFLLLWGLIMSVQGLAWLILPRPLLLAFVDQLPLIVVGFIIAWGAIAVAVSIRNL